MGIFDRIRQLFDRGRDPAALSQWLEVPEQDLRRWLAGRPTGSENDYHTFTVPKRRGGTRQIHAPGALLKDLQRRIYRRLLSRLPLHPAATGFVRGQSIVDNARLHVGQGTVINIDLADFFPSITAERVQNTFQALGWGRASAQILANICTYEGRLPQGAPTSPAISNLVCRRLDTRLSKLVQTAQGRFTGTGCYTRYADDITFSFPAFGRNRARRKKPRGTPWRRPAGPSRGLLKTIPRIIEDEGFKIQKKKRVRIQRAHQRQTVTGLVVNSSVNLPRAVRRRLRAMEHHDRLGKLGKREQSQLSGWRALSAMIAQQRGKALSGD